MPVSTLRSPTAGSAYPQTEPELGCGWFCDPFYTVAETRHILCCSHASVYQWIGKGKLDARKLEGKTLVTGESLRRLAASLPKAGAK